MRITLHAMHPRRTDGATVDGPNSPAVDAHSNNIDDFVLRPVRQIPYDNDAEPAQTLHDRFSAISSVSAH